MEVEKLRRARRTEDRRQRTEGKRLITKRGKDENTKKDL
jgi:hypothetical protein